MKINWRMRPGASFSVKLTVTRPIENSSPIRGTNLRKIISVTQPVVVFFNLSRVAIDLSSDSISGPCSSRTRCTIDGKKVKLGVVKNWAYNIQRHFKLKDWDSHTHKNNKKFVELELVKDKYPMVMSIHREAHSAHYIKTETISSCADYTKLIDSI